MKLKPKIKPSFNETGNVSFDDIESFFDNLNFGFKIPESAVKYKSGSDKSCDIVRYVDLNSNKRKRSFDELW